MSIELPLSRYCFEFEVLDRLQFPTQSGILWHSVFGKNLKDLSCVAKEVCCQKCMFQHQCDYTQLFKGIRPEDSEIMRKSSTIPAPHVFQTLLQPNNFHKVGKIVSIDVVLCGNANDKLPSLTRGLFVSGMKGLGKSRSRLKLQGLTQHTTDGKSKALLQGTQLKDALPVSAMVETKVPEKVSLQFLTPYKPSGQANNGHGIDFGRFLMAIIRRVDLMQYFTTGIKLAADFKELKALTESIPIRSVDLDFLKSSRYSADTNVLKDTSGFIGEVEFDLRNHEKLWPFLEVGQWLNVGKNSSMGFGRYVVASK